MPVKNIIIRSTCQIINKSIPTPTNYRPISLLSTVSKVLEQHVYSQLVTWLCHHPLAALGLFRGKVNGHCSAALHMSGLKPWRMERKYVQFSLTSE